MDIHVKAYLAYAVSQPCDLLLQIEATSDQNQELIAESLETPPDSHLQRTEGEDGIGQRIWLKAEKEFICTYEATVSVDRIAVDLNALVQSPLSTLPSDVVKYLMPSRFCHPEQFYDFTAQSFDTRSGGPLIVAMRDWIYNHFSYVAGASDATTTAHETFNRRQGVCRDYAHVLIAMARAVAIPARIVSGYAPDVTPQDFHAVAEVYLEGAWHLVDPTGMAKPEEIVRIGVGRDAADVSFLTSYGFVEMKSQAVEVNPLNERHKTLSVPVEDWN